MQDPRKLRVYESAKELAVETRGATSLFPAAGYSELKNQMHRSAESIPFNIAEGCGAETAAEFARFLGIGIKSAFELAGQVELALSYRIVPAETATALTDHIIAVRKMLYALRKRVRGIDYPSPSRKTDY
jgi:four helix bundle protein